MARWMISILISISSAALDVRMPAQFLIPPGTVSIPDGVTAIIVNQNGEEITIRPPEIAIQLPDGTYRIEVWTMERTDNAGNIWNLMGTHFGENTTFNLIEGREIKLSIGEPVISTLSVKESDSRYSFDHYLRGQLSEIVEITKNGDRPDPPELHITNADGSYQENLTFAYG